MDRQARKFVVRGALLFSAGISALSLATAVCAQDATDQATKDTSSASEAVPGDAASEQEIVVTGYGASLERALRAKRSLDIISDGIAAEDIGKYPEQNIAESLQRVTGVQITRSLGDGQYISVRGLDPKFTATLYNGRQLPSGSGTRAFDFQVLTSNFANQVDVYKTPTPDMLEGGLAATVNVQSAKPLSVNGRRGSLNLEGVYDEQAAGSPQPHVSGQYIDQFMDGRLGISVGVDYSARRIDDQQASSSGVAPDPAYTGPGTHYQIYGMAFNDDVGTDKRLSATAALQFKASDELEFTLDSIYSRFRQQYKNNQHANWYPASAASGISPLISETLSPENVETAWSGSNVFGYVQSNLFRFDQRMYSNALSLSWHPGEWSVNAEASLGRAIERTTQAYVAWTTLNPGPAISYDFGQDLGGPFAFRFLNGFDSLNSDNYAFEGVQGPYRQPATDRIANAKLDISRTLANSFFSALQFGADAQDRKLNSTPNFMGINRGKFPADMSAYIMATSKPNFFSSYDGPVPIDTTYMAVNLDSFFKDYPLSQIVADNPPVQTLTATTRVEERSLAAYGRVNFASVNDRLRGNFGARFVHTEEISQGYVPNPDATLVYGLFNASLTYTGAGLNAQKHSYNVFLPSFNASFTVNDKLVARVAAARVMQRPDMNLLAQASSPTATGGPPPRGSGAQWYGVLAEGNPALKPYLANQLDVSLEWYFARRSLFSVAGFYKDVKNLVMTNYTDLQTTATIGGNVLNSGYSIGDVAPILLSVAQPVNSSATTIKGVEIGYQQAFTFLPGVLRSFGAQANYTHIWYGKVVTAQGQAPLPLTGISANSYNLGLYYDNGAFDFHANYNYRSGWVLDPISYFGDGAFVKGYGQLDLTANYKINKMFSLNASVVNATQSALRQVDKYGLTRLYELSGRRFYAGVRATF